MPSHIHKNHPLLPALRFLTAGQVDDGKSTLIGRLLYDTQALKTDRREKLIATSSDQINFASLTDGLQSEQAQSITIDVAHHYLNTPDRAFVLLDTPGHEEYTRNMVTAASTCDAAVILIDASRLQKDFTELPLQTKRHTFLAHLLRVPSIVFAINKLDIAPEPVHTFMQLQNILQVFCARIHIQPAGIIPISALQGVNVVFPLKDTQHPIAKKLATVFNGSSLLQLLSTLPQTPHETDTLLHLPIQWVCPQSSVPWGRIAEGNIRIGDEITIRPGGIKARVAQLLANALPPAQTISFAQAGQSVGIRLESIPSCSHLKLKPGQQWLEHTSSSPAPCLQHIKATLVWLDPMPCDPEQTYLLKHQHSWVRAKITHIAHQFDLSDLETKPIGNIQTNAIVEVILTLETALPVRPYALSRSLGSFILVDPQTHQTSAAGLVLG